MWNRFRKIKLSYQSIKANYRHVFDLGDIPKNVRTVNTEHGSPMDL